MPVLHPHDRGSEFRSRVNPKPDYKPTVTTVGRALYANMDYSVISWSRPYYPGGIMPDKAKHPAFVEMMCDALSAVMMRDAKIIQGRETQNHVWYIVDPVFGITGYDRNSGRRDYRAGFQITQVGHGSFEVAFNLVHCPAMAKRFRENLKSDPTPLIEAISGLLRFRKDAAGDIGIRISYDSRKEYAEKRKAGKTKGINCTVDIEIEGKTSKTKLSDPLFAADLFPEKGPIAGNHFYLGPISDEEFLEREVYSEKRLKRFMTIMWPVFALLYPSDYRRKRINGLRRAMVRARIKIKCEKSLIQGLKNSRCQGALEAAHIRPYHRNGSDKPDNGLWLCQKHHRETEGKIQGNRDAITLRSSTR
jgi:hypothetical protein